MEKITQSEFTYTGIAIGNMGKGYDQEVKKVLSDVGILARILKGCVDEFKAMPVEQIIKHIEGVQISEALVEKDRERIIGMNTEDGSSTEGLVKYDILFYALAPGKKELVKLIINIEAQNNLYPGYNLLNRAFYYIARLVSSQKDTEFKNSEYDKIKKVYSIWICYDAAGKANPRIRTMWDAGNDYDLLTEQEKANWQERFYKAILLTLGPAKTPVKEKYINMLSTILTMELNFEEKRSILEGEHGLVLTREVEGGLKNMCNLGYGLAQNAWNKGINQGITQGLTQGRTEGEKNKEIAVIKRMLLAGRLTLAEIAEYADVNIERVEQVKAELQAEA